MGRGYRRRTTRVSMIDLRFTPCVYSPYTVIYIALLTGLIRLLCVLVVSVDELPLGRSKEEKNEGE